MFFNDGSFYEGYWKDGKQNGYGQFLNFDKSFFQGYWEKGAKKKGIMKTQTGILYDIEYDSFGMYKCKSIKI